MDMPVDSFLKHKVFSFLAFEFLTLFFFSHSRLEIFELILVLRYTVLKASHGIDLITNSMNIHVSLDLNI